MERAPGHETIAEVAQARLTPATRTALGRILEGQDDLFPGALAAIAVWPDQVRTFAAHGTIAKGWTDADIQEAHDFNRDNPRNGEWQLVNLPLGAAGYPSDPVAPGNPLRAFVGPDDIVHALTGDRDPRGTDRDPGVVETPARAVPHTPDIHQPMHVTLPRFVVIVNILGHPIGSFGAIGP